MPCGLAVLVARTAGCTRWAMDPGAVCVWKENARHWPELSLLMSLLLKAHRLAATDEGCSGWGSLTGGLRLMLPYRWHLLELAVPLEKNIRAVGPNFLTLSVPVLLGEEGWGFQDPQAIFMCLDTCSAALFLVFISTVSLWTNSTIGQSHLSSHPQPTLTQVQENPVKYSPYAWARHHPICSHQICRAFQSWPLEAKGKEKTISGWDFQRETWRLQQVGKKKKSKNPPVYMNERTKWKALPFTPLQN